MSLKSIFFILLFMVFANANAQTEKDWNKVNNKAYEFYNNGNSDSALLFLNKGLILAEKIFNHSDIELITNRRNVGYLEAQNNNCKRTIELYTLAIDGMFQKYIPDTTQIMNTIVLKLKCLISEEKESQALIELATLTELTDSNLFLANAYNETGLSIEKRENFKVAVPFYKNAFEIINRDTNNKFLASVYLGNIGYCYSKLVNRDSSIHYFWEGSKLLEQANKTESNQYATTAYHLGNELFKIKDYNPAAANFRLAYGKWLLDEKANTKNILLVLNKLIGTYAAMRDDDNVVIYSELKLKHMGNVYDKNDQRYIDMLEEVINVNILSSYCGDIPPFVKELRGISKEQHGELSTEYFNTQLSIAEWYLRCYQKKEAKKQLQAITKISQKVILPESKKISLYRRLATCYKKLDDEENQITFLEKGWSEASLSNNSSLLFFSSELGFVYNQNNNLELATYHLKIADSIYQADHLPLDANYLDLAG